MGIFKVFKDAKRYRKLLEEFGIAEGCVSDVIGTYERVLAELTGGLLSKPTYTKQEVIDAVTQRFCEDCDMKKSFLPVVVFDDGKKSIHCGVCGKGLRRNDKYCPYCGSKVGVANET